MRRIFHLTQWYNRYLPLSHFDTTQVAVKMQHVGQDLRAEAEIHAYAWRHMKNIVRPLGYLNPHETTGNSAALVTELCM